MENVLTHNKELQGFISKKGILIRVVDLGLGGDPVEIIAASILKDIEGTSILTNEIRGRIGKNVNHFFQDYLIERYHYIYIHLGYLDDKIDIKEIIAPRDLFDVTDMQRKKIMSLCKEAITIEEIPKLLEKRNERF